MVITGQTWRTFAGSVVANVCNSTREDALASRRKAMNVVNEERSNYRKTGDPITAQEALDRNGIDLATVSPWASELREVQDRLEQRWQKELKAVEERLLTRMGASVREELDSKPKLGRDDALWCPKSDGLMDELKTLNIEFAKIQDALVVLPELQWRMQDLEAAQRDAARALQAAQEQTISIVHDQVAYIFQQVSADLEGSISHDHGPKSIASVKILPGSDAKTRCLESESTASFRSLSGAGAQTIHVEYESYESTASAKSLSGTDEEMIHDEFESSLSQVQGEDVMQDEVISLIGVKCQVFDMTANDVETNYFAVEDSMTVAVAREMRDIDAGDTEFRAVAKNDRTVDSDSENRPDRDSVGMSDKDEAAQRDRSSTEPPAAEGNAIVVRKVFWSPRHASC